MRRLLPIAPVLALVGCAVPGTVSRRAVPRGVEPFRYTAEVGGERIAVRAFRGGDGGRPRVIFVHGTPGHALGWSHYLGLPAVGVELIAYDRPGFGGTEPTRVFPSLDEQAAALEPLLVERDGVRPVLVGHSLGGPIVAAAAANYPERVGALVILAGSLDPALERVQFVQRLAEFAFVPWLLPAWLRNTNRELLPLEDELRALEPRLESIGVPVEIVHGTRDGLVAYDNVAFMRERLTGVAALNVSTLEGGNHFLVWNAKPDVWTAIGRAVEAASGVGTLRARPAVPPVMPGADAGEPPATASPASP